MFSVKGLTKDFKCNNKLYVDVQTPVLAASYIKYEMTGSGGVSAHIRRLILSKRKAHYESLKMGKISELQQLGS